MAELPNQSQQNVVTDLMGHPVVLRIVSYLVFILLYQFVLSRFVVPLAAAVSLDHGVDDDVPEVAGAGLARDAGHLGLVLHDEAPLDRQHIQNLEEYCTSNGYFLPTFQIGHR